MVQNTIYVYSLDISVVLLIIIFIKQVYRNTVEIFYNDTGCSDNGFYDLKLLGSSKILSMFYILNCIGCYDYPLL